MNLVNRLAFLFAVIGFALPTIAATADLPAAAPDAKRPPNILFILADDLGWKDVGYNGTDFYETPNIDKLRTEGMMFSNAYAAAGNCAPSRACLMSGQYTPRHGVFAVMSTDRGPKNLQRLIPISNREDLAPEITTMAEALKANGYVTGIFGKWHLSTGPETEPTAQGFDVYFDSRKENSNKELDLPEDPKGIYSLTREAIAFIEKNRDRPFFAYVCHHAIHSRLEARPASLAKFKAKKPGVQHNAALYAACTYDLDDGVGLLLKKLQELGLDKNTVVVFTSDNGGTQQSSQEPLRGNKGGYYDGGIREPLLVRWPGQIAAGSTCDTPVINQDFYPTFLALAQAPRLADSVLDGENLLPLLRDPAAKLTRQSIFWHFPGYLDSPVTRGRDPIFRTRPVTVIRKGDWKLHFYHEEWVLDGGRGKLATNRAVELYNMKTDGGEHHDLAQIETAKRDELLADVLAWIKTVRAPIPTQPNPKYDHSDAHPKKGKGRKNKNADASDRE